MKSMNCLILALLLGASTPQLFAAKMTNPNKRHEEKLFNGPKIRTLLEKDVLSSLFEVKGEYVVLHGETKKVLSKGITGKRFVVHGMKEGLRWGEEYPDVFQIAVVPRNKETSFFINGIQYKGSIIVTQGTDYKIHIVNEVPIEDYVQSTLAVKLQSTLSKEALAALVITARTEAFYMANRGNPSSRLWDVIATDCEYFGSSAAICSKHLAEALEATRFMVMKKAEAQQDVPFRVRWGLSKEGVDLSLAGAEELAAKGYDARKILTTFFPLAKIVTTCQPAPLFLR